MSTPLGHSLLGLSAASLGERRVPLPPLAWYGFAVVAANAPDLDFLVGQLLGDANRYHQQFSHSILAALLFGALAAAIARFFVSQPLRLGLFSALVYSTHLLLDYLTYDGRPPFGIPLLWPLSEEHFVSPVTIFHGVRHGVPGDSIESVLAQIFSWTNVSVLAVEAAVLVPLCVIAWVYRQRPIAQLR